MTLGHDDGTSSCSVPSGQVSIKSGQVHYAILRISKHSSSGSVKASGDHIERQRETLNANLQLTPNNHTLIGSGDLAKDVAERLLALQYTHRGNSVQAIEHLLTASPAYFDFDPITNLPNPAKLQAFEQAAVAWAQKHYGKENVVAAKTHLDEITPHIHLTVVPLIEKDVKVKYATSAHPDAAVTQRELRLSARDYTGGRRRCSQLQDSFADAVRHLGIQRGIRGAQIVYKDLHTRYAEMTETPPKAEEIKQAMETARLPRLASKETHRELLIAATMPMITALAAHDEEVTRKREAAEKRQAALQRDLDAARAAMALSQLLHLEQVLQAYRARKDKDDPGIWLVGNERISLLGQYFHNWALGPSGHAVTHGQGAVQLVMQLSACSPETALALLARRFGEDLAVHAAAEFAAVGIAPTLHEWAKQITMEPLPLARPAPELAKPLARSLVQLAPAQNRQPAREQSRSAPARTVEPAPSTPAPTLAPPQQAKQQTRSVSRPVAREDEDQAKLAQPVPSKQALPNLPTIAPPTRREDKSQRGGGGGRGDR